MVMLFLTGVATLAVGGLIAVVCVLKAPGYWRGDDDE